MKAIWTILLLAFFFNLGAAAEAKSSDREDFRCQINKFSRRTALASEFLQISIDYRRQQAFVQDEVISETGEQFLRVDGVLIRNGKAFFLYTLRPSRKRMIRDGAANGGTTGSVTYSVGLDTNSNRLTLMYSYGGSWSSRSVRLTGKCRRLN